MLKTAILMVGLPGSGKSTYARRAISAAAERGESWSYHSTDDFMVIGGRYVWRPAKLGEFHARNLNDFALSCAAGTNLVICDNTNLPASSREPYVKLARAMGYTVEICVVGRFDDESALIYAERNSHGVPLESIEKMIVRYQPPSKGECDKLTYVTGMSDNA